jgi:hypothetical protein
MMISFFFYESRRSTGPGTAADAAISFIAIFFHQVHWFLTRRCSLSPFPHETDAMPKRSARWQEPRCSSSHVALRSITDRSQRARGNADAACWPQSGHRRGHGL